MERPVGVTILAVLYFIGAACAGLGGLLFIVGGSMLSGLARSRTAAGPGGALLAMGGAVIGVICLVIAAVYFVLGFGFIKLQNWARILAIVFIIIGLLFGILGMLAALTHPVILVVRLIIAAIQIWILVYLFKPHVKQAFGA